MSVHDDVPLSQRVAALEQSIAEILRRLDSISSAYRPHRPAWPGGVAVPTRAARSRIASPFPGRNIEWWLARGGAGSRSIEAPSPRWWGQ